MLKKYIKKFGYIKILCILYQYRDIGIVQKKEKITPLDTLK
jgi:hypothetical protein